MIELLQNISTIIKWFFTDILLECAKVQLGIIDEFKEIIGIVLGIPLFVAGVIKLIKIKTR